MAVEQKGPGGVTSSYGPRITKNTFDTSKSYDQKVFADSDGGVIGPDGQSLYGGFVEDGLLKTVFNGNEYASVPVNPDGSLSASVVMRYGALDTMKELDGYANEIAVLSDTRGLVLYNGVAGEGRFFYPDQAGRTMVLNVNSTLPWVDGVVDIPPDVTLLVVRASSLLYGSSFSGLIFRFNGARDPRQPFRVISDFSIAWATGVNGGPATLNYTNVSGGEFVDRTYVMRDGAYQLVSAFGGAKNRGCTTIGIGASDLGFTNSSVGIGDYSVITNDSEVAFGAGEYALGGKRRNSIYRLGGSTISASQALTLIPGSAYTNGLYIDGESLGGAAVIGMTVDLMGKVDNSDEFCRFIRHTNLRRTAGGTLSLLAPATQNNPSDVITSGMTGSSLSFAADTASSSFKINVVAPSTAKSVKWQAVVYANVMGNG